MEYQAAPREYALPVRRGVHPTIHLGSAASRARLEPQLDQQVPYGRDDAQGFQVPVACTHVDKGRTF